MSKPVIIAWTFLLYMLCTIMLGGSVTIAYWSNDRASPIEVEYKVLTPEVQPGGRLMIEQKVDYLRLCAAHADRFLYDSGAVPNRKTLEDVDFARPPLGLGKHPFTITERVPDDFREGKGYYVVNTVYRCNPYHDWFAPMTRPSTRIEFTIKR